MIRAKQLSNLSSTARSFFVSGSRVSPADTSPSCAHSEDDTGVPRKQEPRNNILLLQNPSTLVSKTSSKVDTSVLGGTVKSFSPLSDGSIPHSASRPQITSGPRNGGLNFVEQGAAQSSTPVSNQFVRGSAAAISFISDVVSYKIPVLDGSGIDFPKNCMVGSTGSVSNVKYSGTKSIRRENISKVHRNSSPGTAVGSDPNTNNHSNKGNGCKSSSGRGYKQASGDGTSNSGGSRWVPSSRSDNQRRTAPERPKAQPNQFLPKFSSSVQPSDEKYVECFTEDYRGSRRYTNMSAVKSPTNQQFAGSAHIVENVSQVLRQQRWGPAAEEALGNLNFRMDAYQANQVLKQLQDYTVAHGFFYWLRQQPGFKHDGHTYTTMIGILGRAKQFGSINKLLEQMMRDGCQPNVVTYNRLIHSYGRANYLDKAVDVFHEMQDVGCEPDRVTYCTLIDIHAKAGFLDFAMGMYGRMQQVGLSPDTFTYSVMINCLGKSGDLAAAERLFGEMVQQGCVPNVVTFNIMIALQAKTRNYETALKLYRDMQNAGFKPDKVTYSIVMEVLGHCGYLDEAEAVFYEMRWKNWVPDEPVYGLLVDLWGKAGNVEKAWQWYQAMLQTGLRPNVPTCNSLLNAFLRVHRLEDAYNLLQNMLSLGLNPSLQTYTLLLSFCTEALSPYDLTFCRKLMAVTSHPAHMFLLSMPSAGPDGQNVRDHVSSFLDLMHSEDRESKRGLVDAVVDFLHKSGLKEEAGSVWEVAALKNVYPDAVKEKSSSYWLINLHVMSDGTAITALSRILAWFRRQMLVSGVSPYRIDIITGWGRRSRVTGTSLVRQAVEELLNIFSFPFFTEKGNTGCFVGCGEPLNRWLLQSCVERMHLL